MAWNAFFKLLGLDGSSLAKVDPAGNQYHLSGDAQVSTSLTAVGSQALIANGVGYSSWSVSISGTWLGTLYFETSDDYTGTGSGTWYPNNGRQVGVTNTTLASSVVGTGAALAVAYRGNLSSNKYWRVRAGADFVSGTGVTVVANASMAPGAVFLNASIPMGSNLLGGIWAAIVRTLASANLTEGTQTQIALDAKARVRVATESAMDPWQNYIERYGSMTVNSASDLLLSNTVATATSNYPTTQVIDYVVGLQATRTTSNTGSNTVVSLSYDGTTVAVAGTYNLVSSCGTNAPATKLTSNNGATITSNSFDGVTNIVQGTYVLTLSPGTAATTIKVTWNGVVLDNQAVNATGVTVDGGAAGKIVLTMPAAAPVTAQSDNVTVTGTFKFAYNGSTAVDNITPSTYTGIHGGVAGYLTLNVGAYTATFGTDVMTVSYANKTGYLKRILITADSPPSTALHISFAINGIKKLHYELNLTSSHNTGSNTELDYLDLGLPLPTGTQVQVYARTIGGSATAIFVRFDAFEELN